MRPAVQDTSRRTSAGGAPRALLRQAWVPRASAPAPNTNPNPNDPNPNHPRQRRHHVPRAADSQPREEDSEAPAPEAALPQLVQEIQDKLARGAVECMICYDMVRRSAPIWSCSSCFSIFHLACIRKWARSPTSSADATATATASSWRCPGCQSTQTVPPKDLHYTCFCGRRREPPNDFYLTPHSCGEPCCRPLDRHNAGSLDKVEILEDEHDDDEGLRERCHHVCVLQCHPGPCPPCKAFAPKRRCPCGKKTIVRRCSDQASPATCGQRCDRLLSCRRHRCDRVCHTGACNPCGVAITASCFCRRKMEVVLCGDMAIKGEVVESEGVFSCDGVCGKLLGCGNHNCDENCHPGPCGDCELLPGKIKTCHCGKTRLLKERESCLDPIPTCSNVCEKLHPCSIHQCKETCHEGDCPPCSTKVVQKCRCGSATRTVECYIMMVERNNFVCEKPCGRKKGCGRHRCSERCCPLSKAGGQPAEGDWDPHLCSIPCGKRLQCGQHSCQLLCHSGHCPPCLETIFTDLTCACGRTSIPPPLPCGTPNPSCQHPCLVPQPCGHAASHTCHFGDCPPCSVPVTKECIGGHVLLRNIPCGSKDIRCNQLCGKTGQCGMHACGRTCHPPPCDASCGGSVSESGSSGKLSCGQVCGAPRRDCKHTCTASCHPLAPCPDLRCEFPVTITCSCGRITASVPCGTGGNTNGYHTDTVFEASVMKKLPVPLQKVEANGMKVPFGQRKLTCDEECTKLERKRVLAEAFDISPPNLDALHFGENAASSELLANLFRRDPKWVLAVEDRFKFLVMGKIKGVGASSLKVHVFCHMTKEKRDAVRLIAERWKLSVQAAGWEPKRFLVVHATPKSRPAARILGSKPGTTVSSPIHQLSFDPLLDMDPRLVVSMLDLPRDADISALVLRFGGECELVWLNDKNALAVFSDPMRAATALRRLDHGSVYHGAVVVLQNLGASKEGGPVSKSSNPWKKVVGMESDSWGSEWSAGASASLPAWRHTEAAPITASVNRWNALDLGESVSIEEQSLGPSECKLDSLSSAGQDAGIGKVEMNGEAVDDWEEACD